MEWILKFFAVLLDQVTHVLLFPLNPGNRIFWLYLLSSAAAAFFVYTAIQRRDQHYSQGDAEAANGSFLQFLFPKSVWSHSSAWLDLRYAFFHKFVSHSLILGLGVVATALGYRLASGGQSFDEVIKQKNLTTPLDWVIGIGFMFVALFLVDFIGWFIHYLQHRVPVLWQFHKVHHSAEVMHPISNFREHPIDNIAYSFFSGLGMGVIFALAVRFFGVLPKMPMLIGVPVLMFLFNFTAYNLRHSHVWLRWPGIWSIVFPSPAHHHVHHSRHPDHIDKNFAFMFPVWDLIFGTYTMPNDNRDVEFGVTEGDDEDLDGVLRLYWVPFRDAYRVLTGKNQKGKPSPSSSNEEPETK